MTVFKPIEYQDIEVIVALMKVFYEIDAYSIDISVSQKNFATFIANPNLGRAWLIYQKKEVVGYIILTFLFSFEYGGTIAFLDELYLAKNSRGKGLGKKAVAFVKDQAKQHKLRLLYLEVERHNSTGQKLYLAAGFEFHNRNLMRIKLNDRN